MEILKVKNGLLEAENYFLASSFGDFAGSATVTRDLSTGKLQLISNDMRIERKFNFNDFVIEIEKANFETMVKGDYSMLYLGNDNYTFGIKDALLEQQNKYWKILRENDYIQAYTSLDGVNYTNIGGMNLAEPLTKQGFQKSNTNPFILDSYKLYSGPYLTIQNFPEGTTCELYDSNNNLLKTKTFDSKMECKIYLDYNNLNGHLRFKDPNESTIFTTGNFTFSYGDVWIISPYNFEIQYIGTSINNVTPAILQDLDEVITIKNLDNIEYTGINIGTQTNSDDLIEISLDGLTYSSTLILDFEIYEIKQIYVKITKNISSTNFSVRDFQLVIN